MRIDDSGDAPGPWTLIGPIDFELDSPSEVADAMVEGMARKSEEAVELVGERDDGSWDPPFSDEPFDMTVRVYRWSWLRRLPDWLLPGFLLSVYDLEGVVVASIDGKIDDDGVMTISTLIRKATPPQGGSEQ